MPNVDVSDERFNDRQDTGPAATIVAVLAQSYSRASSPKNSPACILRTST